MQHNIYVLQVFTQFGHIQPDLEPRGYAAYLFRLFLRYRRFDLDLGNRVDGLRGRLHRFSSLNRLGSVFGRDGSVAVPRESEQDQVLHPLPDLQDLHLDPRGRSRARFRPRRRFRPHL